MLLVNSYHRPHLQLHAADGGFQNLPTFWWTLTKKMRGGGKQGLVSILFPFLRISNIGKKTTSGLGSFDTNDPARWGFSSSMSIISPVDREVKAAYSNMLQKFQSAAVNKTSIGLLFIFRLLTEFNSTKSFQELADTKGGRFCSLFHHTLKRDFLKRFPGFKFVNQMIF